MEVAAVTDETGLDEWVDPHLYLTFVIDREPFAIGILCVKEILVYETPTQIPMMPEFVRGLVNLRGEIVPVIDLAARFGRASSVPGKRTCLVIVETASEDRHYVFGVVVDAVNEVLEIPESAIEPPPSFGTLIRADFIQGMGKVRDKFVNILQLDSVLSIGEIETLAASGPPA